MKPLKYLLSALVLLCSSSCAVQEQKTITWEERLQQQLPVMGHRNWIVIADSAYPKQSAAGIETIATGADQLEVLSKVLKDIDRAPHVKALILLDQELDQVPEADAPGVTKYREALRELLKDEEPTALPHEDIIKQLDEGSKLFNVLVLKTKMTIPYTSVFIQLDCGYWDAEKETRLRKILE